MPRRRSTLLEQLYDHEEYLECRRAKHRLDPLDAMELPKKGGYIQVDRCARCKAEKITKMDREGYVISTSYSYTYAEGYLIKGLGRMTRKDYSALRVDFVIGLVKRHQGQHVGLSNAGA